VLSVELSIWARQRAVFECGLMTAFVQVPGLFDCFYEWRGPNGSDTPFFEVRREGRTTEVWLGRLYFTFDAKGGAE